MSRRSITRALTAAKTALPARSSKVPHEKPRVNMGLVVPRYHDRGEACRSGCSHSTAAAAMLRTKPPKATTNGTPRAKLAFPLQQPIASARAPKKIATAASAELAATMYSGSQSEVEDGLRYDERHAEGRAKENEQRWPCAPKFFRGQADRAGLGVESSSSSVPRRSSPPAIAFAPPPDREEEHEHQSDGGGRHAPTESPRVSGAGAGSSMPNAAKTSLGTSFINCSMSWLLSSIAGQNAAVAAARPQRPNIQNRDVTRRSQRGLAVRAAQERDEVGGAIPVRTAGDSLSAESCPPPPEQEPAGLGPQIAARERRDRAVGEHQGGECQDPVADRQAVVHRIADAGTSGRVSRARRARASAP